MIYGLDLYCIPPCCPGPFRTVDHDQLLVYNHALLLFSRMDRTALFYADIDEFLILKVILWRGGRHRRCCIPPRCCTPPRCCIPVIVLYP